MITLPAQPLLSSITTINKRAGHSLYLTQKDPKTQKIKSFTTAIVTPSTKNSIRFDIASSSLVRIQDHLRAKPELAHMGS